MRTGRSLTVCCSLLPGGCVPGLGWCLLQGGCLLLGGCLVGGGMCLVWGGVCSWGGCLLRGVSARGGVCSGGVSHHALRQTPLPSLWTDTRLWKYYLGPTSLRPVIIYNLIIVDILKICFGVEYNLCANIAVQNTRLFMGHFLRPWYLLAVIIITTTTKHRLEHWLSKALSLSLSVLGKYKMEKLLRSLKSVCSIHFLFTIALVPF